MFKMNKKPLSKTKKLWSKMKKPPSLFKMKRRWSKINKTPPWS